MFLPFKPEHVSFFDGIIRFDPIYFSIVLLVLVHFIYIQYVEYKSSDFKIDFWGFNIGLKLVIPLFVMYPFNLSFFNYISIGISINATNQFLESVLMVSVVGYIMVYFGRYIYDLRSKPFYNLTIFENIFEKNLKSGDFLIVIQILTYIFSFFTISQQISAGELFNGRNFYQFNITYRPIYNALVVIYGVNFITIFLFYLQTQKIKYLYFLIPVILIGFTLGSRGSLLEPILSCYLFWMFKNYKNFKIRYLIFGIIGFLFAIVILLALRGGSASELNTDDFAFELLYGNSFSDARDFAFVLTFWDGEYIYGKSYVAALMSFVPKFVSELRQSWSFSHITNKMIGFDNDHPGMRLGMFGEVFFNFAYIGVVLLGFFYGYIMRAMDKNIKVSIIKYNDLQMAFSKTFLSNLLIGIAITAAFSSFYFSVFICVLGLLIRKILFKRTNFNKKFF